MNIIRSTGLAVAITSLLFGFSGLAESQERRVRPTERPFLWMIEGETPSFLYGTIHVPDPRVTALPTVVEKAIELSDALFTEVPMEADMQMSMARHVMLPAGQGLSTRVSPELLQRLDAYAKRKGLGGAAPFEQLKVWCTSMQLQMLEMNQEQRSGGESGGKALDQMLYDRAKTAGKEVAGLETLEEQLGCFDLLTDAEQARMLAAALDALEAPAERSARKKPLEAVVKKYLAGDLDALIRALDLQQGGDDEELVARMKQALIIDRNHRMAERITARLREHPAKGNFFAVGTAHYHGDEGVIALLEAQGFKVRRLAQADAKKLQPASAGAR